MRQLFMHAGRSGDMGRHEFYLELRIHPNQSHSIWQMHQCMCRVATQACTHVAGPRSTTPLRSPPSHPAPRPPRAGARLARRRHIRACGPDKARVGCEGGMEWRSRGC